MPNPQIALKRLGLADYEHTWRAMQAFNAQRSSETPDELWLLEHPPVFTLGLAGKPEHLLGETDIPIVKTDRGGQVTYHGPGQVIIYLLLNLAQRDLKVRPLVTCIEQAVMDCLAEYGIAGERVAGAPGVYVGGAKIAALGLRIKGGCCYHGVSLNVDMDLQPYATINPCGYPGLEVTQMVTQGVKQMSKIRPALNCATVGEKLLTHLLLNLKK